MPELTTISPEEPQNKGLNYAALKEEGTQLVQAMSGDIWTDYNESDPGVTTLEQFCYALTELSYRAEFPLEDLLLRGPAPADRIDPHRQALFVPRRIFPCNPLTEDDYRKLIVDRVDGVANVWLRCRPPERSHGVDGLYNIELYVPRAGSLAEEINLEEISERTRRLYCRHRNLCEDVNAHDIRILQPESATVDAEVTIDPMGSPEAILADIFFQLGNFLAPELRREPLKRRLKRGEAPDEIFNGPLLYNGFIDNTQLQPKADKIPVQELVKIIVRCPGVIGVRDVSVQMGGSSYQAEQSIPVPPEKILRLRTKPTRTGYTIRLWQNGIRQQPNPLRVRRELDKRWVEYRRRYPLAAQYKEFFALPRGRYRDLQQYYSVQNQFPNVYGINEYGLPDKSSQTRQAQAKQFKGYLLVFEQLLADYFAQLAHVKDLYSIEHGLEPTYFYQYLLKSVPDVAPLLVDGPRHYQAGLGKIVRGQDPFVQRRNRFLDLLLALYAEKLDASSVWITSQDRHEERGGERLVEAKRAMLQELVRSTANRGRGFDYLARRSPLNAAGMAIKSRIQLGMSAVEHRGIFDVLQQHGIQLVRSNAEVSSDHSLSGQSEHIQAHFAPVTLWVQRKQPHSGVTRAGQVPLLRPQEITETHVRASAVIENFRVGQLPGDSHVALVCKLPQGRWWLVAKYPDDDHAAETVQAAVDLLHDHCRQLYIIEHNLLRFGQHRHGHHHRRFACNFTITAVVSECPCARSKQEREQYRTFVREVIRQNAPAHIAVDYCFLHPWRMWTFERFYCRWRWALRTGEDLDGAAERLREFLLRHRP